MTREIPEDIRYDFAVMIEQMIFQMLTEDQELSSQMAIKILAKQYNVNETDLRQCLINIESDFTKSSSIIYFDGKTFVKRTTLLARVMKIYYKIITSLIKIDNPNLSETKIKSLIEKYRRNDSCIKDEVDITSFFSDSGIVYKIIEECYG